MPGFFVELKKRNVFRAGLAYLALAWLVIEVTDMAIAALNLPDSLLTIVFYLGLIGLPFALLFAWAFELTPEGIKRSEDVSEQESIRRETGRKIERTILAMVSLTLVFVIWDAYIADPEDTPRQVPAAATDAQSPSVASAQPGQGAHSIAVLPFVNMSDDKDYFADGLSEELLNLLARIPDLKVAGRTSSFAFKGRNEDLRLIGEALGVSTVLEGSVRKSGERLRVTAQLINVEDGFHIWSQTYDREMTDIFEIQDDIALAITGALKMHLVGAAPSLGLPTTSMEAYELYLRAKPMIVRFDKIGEAEQLLHRAVELDPDFAAAWDGLWLINSNYCAYGLKPCREVEPKKEEYARRAFQLDPSLAMAGYIAGQDSLSWEEHLAAQNEVIRQAPNTIRAYDWLGNSYMQIGWFDRAIDTFERGLKVDPYFPDLLPQYAMALEAVGRRSESEQAYIKWGDIVGIPHTRLWIAMRYLDAGPQEEADRLIAAYTAARGGDPVEIEAYLRELMDPATREAAIEDQRWERYMNIPSGEGMWRAIFYVLMDDDQVWPTLDRMIQAGTNGYMVGQQLLANYRSHSLLEHPEYERRAREQGYDRFWRDNGLPDFCQQGHQSWICELEVVR